MDELVKEADTIVAAEIEERRKQREKDAASTDAQLDSVKEDDESEVSSA